MNSRDKEARRLLMDGMRRSLDIVDFGFKRYSSTLLSAYSSLPARLSKPATILYFLMCEREFFERNKDTGKVQSKFNRRWTRCVSADDMKEALSKNSFRPSSTYTAERLRGLDMQAIFFPFRYGSNRGAGISTTWTYMKMPLQWGPFQRADLDERSELDRSNAVVLCPASVLSLCQAWKDGCYVVVQDQTSSDKDASQDETWDKAVAAYAGRFMADKVARMPKRLSAEIPPLAGDPREYLEKTLPSILGQMDQYDGIVLDECVFRRLKLPEASKKKFVAAFEEAKKGASACDRNRALSSIASLFSLSDLDFGNSRTLNDLDFGNSRSLKGISKKVKDRASKDLRKLDPHPVYPIEEKEEPKVPSDLLPIMPESPSGALSRKEETGSAATRGNNGDGTATEEARMDVQVGVDTMSKEFLEMSRDLLHASQQVQKQRKIEMRPPAPKKEVHPEKAAWDKCAPERRFRPDEGPASERGFYSRFVEVMKEVFGTSVKFPNMIVQKEVAKEMLDVMERANCKNNETAEAWIRWYSGKVKPADAAVYGVSTVTMRRTWSEFERYRPRAPHHSIPSVSDPIGNSLRNIFKTPEPRREDVIDACAMYGVVVVANWLKVCLGSFDLAETIVRDALTHPDVKLITIKSVFRSTRDYEVGAVVEDAVPFKDWMTRFSEIWLKAGCSSSEKPAKVGRSGVDAFFKSNIFA